MADRIHLSVISAGGVVLDQMVSYVLIPAEAGTVGVLAGHMPMLCAVGKGLARCTFGQNEMIRFSVNDGVVHVANDEVTFLVSGASIIEE
jgi:F-type H+-transporting ATPase subunit epsilon